MKTVCQKAAKEHRCVDNILHGWHSHCSCVIVCSSESKVRVSWRWWRLGINKKTRRRKSGCSKTGKTMRPKKKTFAQSRWWSANEKTCHLSDLTRLIEPSSTRWWRIKTIPVHRFHVTWMTTINNIVFFLLSATGNFRLPPTLKHRCTSTTFDTTRLEIKTTGKYDRRDTDTGSAKKFVKVLESVC